MCALTIVGNYFIGGVRQKENLFEFWTEEVRQWGSQGLINEAELDDLSDILNIKIIKECFMKKKDFSVASEKKEHILGSISKIM